MKKHQLLLTLFLAVSLVSCNSTNSENEGGETINPGDNPDFNYTYLTPKTYEGVINSSISYDVLSSIGVDIDIFSSYITFTYQEMDGEINDKNFDKAFKFHMNFDLYSIKETYESSLLTSSLFPLIFNDFKYQNILNNVSDLDIYYLADGNIYTTISRFSDNKKPSRNNKEEIKNTAREIIGTSKLDISSLFEMINSSNVSSISLKDIFSQISSLLNGLTLDFSLFDMIISSTILSFVNDGFSLNFKDNGLNAFSLIFNNFASYIFKNNDIGITLDENEPLINITSATIESNPLEFKMSFEDENSLKPLFYLSLTRNDSKSISIEPPFNLEEDYLIQKNALKDINNLYNLYDNYSLDSETQKGISEAIQNINALNDEEKKRVENFNNYLSYPLLKMDENNIYTELNEKENLSNFYKKIENVVIKKVDSDSSFINAYKALNELFNSKYSINTKYNLLNDVAKNNSSRFNEFKNEVNTYLNTFINPIYNELSILLEDFIKDENNNTLTKEHELLEKIYNLVVLREITLDDDKVISLDEYNNKDKIKSLSTEIINNTINYLSLTSSLINEELNQKISNILLAYFNDLTIFYNKLSENDLTKFNEYSSYLLINDENDDIYSIFELISNNNEKYYSTLKRKNDELINLLLTKVDKFANKRIDEFLTKDEIYYILNIDRLNKTKKELDDIFSMLNVYISSTLFKNYSSSLTFIDKYHSLVSLINEQIANLS